MKSIDYISDTHFDTQLGSWEHVPHERFLELFEQVFIPIFSAKASDTLIIAGDLGENNHQSIATLRLIRDRIGYRHIVIVLGNHDWYLPNPDALETYGTSINRILEFKVMIEQEESIHLLDGNAVEIDGVRIGGAMGWYDGSYVFHNLNPYFTKNREYLQRLWGEVNPDGNNITELETFDGFRVIELQKIEKVYQGIDVIVTHFSPSVRPEHSSKRWRQEDSTGFFTFNGKRFLEETDAQFWIFGHTHDLLEFEHSGVQCRCNPLGYPGSWAKNFKVRSIHVQADN